MKTLGIMNASSAATLSGVSGHPWRSKTIIDGRMYTSLHLTRDRAVEQSKSVLRDNGYNPKTLEKNNE
jgi:hypothetical protein